MLQMLATKSVARQIDQVNLCLIFRPILWREGKEEAAICKQDRFPSLHRVLVHEGQILQNTMTDTITRTNGSNTRTVK
jgi:hypothetical protein